MKHSRALRGFTLAEVLVALAVMSIAVVGLSSVLLSSLKLRDKTSESAVARALASRIMQGTLSSVLMVPRFWHSNHPRESDPWSEGKETVGHTVYTYFVLTQSVEKEISGPMTVYDNEMKRVSVVVRWSGTKDGMKAGSGKLEVAVTALANHRP